MTEQKRELVKLAEAWSEANRHDAVGMGSATAGSARAVESAGEAFVRALAHTNPRDVANAILSAAEPPRLWCIFKLESRKGWWRPGSHGYTTRAAEAGKFTAHEVCEILERGTPGDNLPVHQVGAKDDTYPGTLLR